MITGVRQGLLSAGQGIVVGGSRAGTIRIHDNVVEDTVEGIHVGLSTPSIGGREAADEVVIARNHIHLLVPRLYDRERHAVFAGNVRSLHILERPRLRPDPVVTVLPCIGSHDQTTLRPSRCTARISGGRPCRCAPHPCG